MIYILPLQFHISGIIIIILLCLEIGFLKLKTIDRDWMVGEWIQSKAENDQKSPSSFLLDSYKRIDLCAFGILLSFFWISVWFCYVVFVSDPSNSIDFFLLKSMQQSPFVRNWKHNLSFCILLHLVASQIRDQKRYAFISF